MPGERSIELLEKWRLGRSSDQENQELLSLLESQDGITELSPELQKLWEQVPKESTVYTKTEEGVRFILNNFPAEKKLEADLTAATHRIHFLKTAWFKYAAAILITVGIGTYLWNTNKKTEQPLANNNKRLQTDIPPGGEKAVLTLADGTKIILDSAANGNLAQQGNAQVEKLANGQIAYNLQGLSSKDVMMNTMTTPAGGQYQVTLPDGTKVWLNAASSVTFPAAFVSKNRQVKISGEVYFEVAKNREKPFIVDIGGNSTVEVLGTSFNINSYGDEGAIKTTLLEGSVKIIKGNKKSVLKPGYQAVVASSDRQSESKNSMINIQPADMDQTLAWKNGLFNFDGLELHMVMHQLERWYDIKVKYESQVSNLIFRGKMYRNENLSDVLDMIKKLGVKFRLEGKTLIVTE